VDGDADWTKPWEGVVYSAFGYTGQKCSACSRLIVHEAAYNRFLERLAEATKSVVVGPPTEARDVDRPGD